MLIKFQYSIAKRLLAGLMLIFINTANASESLETAYQVTDFAGNKVVLDKPASRIIALAPHIVENVFSAGAGDALIAVVTYSNYPPQANDLPIVGSYQSVNQERIIELNPDLIIAWESGNSHQNIQQLKELGFNIYIDQPDTLEDVAKSIRDIGVLTAKQSVAEPAAKTYLDEITQLRITNEGKSKVSAFYQVWNQPLHTINGKHIISSAMRLCGGVNIYADEFAVAPIINIESILEKDPSVIIASGMSNARPEWLDDWLKWPSLSAVQQGNLFFVEPEHIQRHTLRILKGVNAICTHLDIARQRLVKPSQ